MKMYVSIESGVEMEIGEEGRGKWDLKAAASAALPFCLAVAAARHLLHLFFLLSVLAV